MQWLLPAMKVINLQYPTKISLCRFDDGLIPEKRKAEVYLGSMESKHTTTFTRKKRAKKTPLCLHFDRFWHWTLFSSHCLCYIHIDTTSSACVYTDIILDDDISRHIRI
jgi:hypothetical protein